MSIPTPQKSAETVLVRPRSGRASAGLLRRAYPRFRRHCDAYDFRRLTKSHWLGFIKRLGKTRLGDGPADRAPKPAPGGRFVHTSTRGLPRYLAPAR